MKKRFLSIFITCCMLLTLLPAAVLAADSDFVIENGVLTEYKGAGGSVTIPGTVTVIGQEAFFDCPGLIAVTIPDSITNIGDGAFAFCRSLTSVNLPNSVTEIGDRAFYECTSLSGVTIPGSVTNIGEKAFAFCRSLTSVSVPTSVTNIGDKALAYCDNLTAIYYEGTREQWAAINPTDYQDKMHFGSTAPTLPSTWAVELVNEAIAAGIVPADLQGKYTANTTRAEFCALAVQLYETVTGTQVTGRVTFTDTIDPNVEKAVYLGIASGVGDGKFNPSGALTREQAAVMLSQLADALGMPLPDAQPDFADTAAVSSWARSRPPASCPVWVTTNSTPLPGTPGSRASSPR